MDGNSRWARSRGLPRTGGHEAGVRALQEVIRLSSAWGLKALTVFAFSSENWERSKAEVTFLMALFERSLIQQLPSLQRENMRVRFIGDIQKLPASLQNLIKKVQDNSLKNTGLMLNIAVSYSGRQDITQACRSLAEKVQKGILKPSEINEDSIERELETNWMGDLSPPDLLIRTSGEKRLSNFLLWQTAYSELFFSEAFWPDFGEEEFREAIVLFQKRERRFGKRRT